MEILFGISFLKFEKSISNIFDTQLGDKACESEQDRHHPEASFVLNTAQRQPQAQLATACFAGKRVNMTRNSSLDPERMLAFHHIRRILMPFHDRRNFQWFCSLFDNAHIFTNRGL